MSTQEKVLIENAISDFKYIIFDDNFLTSKNFNKIHIKCFKWLSDQIKVHKDKKIIVMTHHLPSFSLIDKKYENYKCNSAFASKLDYLIEKENVKYWFFGHSHSSTSTIINGCNLIANPLGYQLEHKSKNINPTTQSSTVYENEDYKRNLVVKIE
jgi:Icc-related predicted phosphoesterase